MKCKHCGRTIFWVAFGMWSGQGKWYHDDTEFQRCDIARAQIAEPED